MSRTEDSSESKPSAMSVALRYLSHAERFEAEIRRKLAEFDEVEVENVIATLKRQNIINDRRTLGSFCQSHEGRRALGAHRLEQELKQKGVPEELVAEVCGREGEEERARDVLVGKFAPRAELKPKGYRFLISRGFSFEIAHNAVRDFFLEDV